MMWKRSFLALLLWTGLASAQTGYFLRTDCDSITSPVNDSTVCTQTTTTGGRTAGHLYVRRSGAWVDVDTTGGSVNFDDIGTGTNTTATMTVGTGGAMNVSGSGTIAATTADALAAAPNNCSAGQAPTGIDTIGDAQNCTAYQTPITTGNLSATAPIAVSASRQVIGGAADISCAVASGAQAGCLSSTDWTTFNNKGSGTVTSVAQSFTGGLISVGGSPITTTGTLALTVAGTSGGIPYFDSATSWASSAALTANLPVIGGGAGVAPSVGTRSGNTTTFATTTGTLTSGNCVKIDANGNLVDHGSACGGSGSPGGSDTHVQFNDGGSFGGDAGFTYNKTTDTATIGQIIDSGLTASRPVISDSSKQLASGSYSGNTTTVVTTTGTQTSGDCVSIDANGNHVAAGAACGVATATDLQVFTNTGDNTWTKPSGTPKVVRVKICGPGGGGGGGSAGNTSAARGGGGGGGAGSCPEAWFLAADLAGTVTVHIGTGGAGAGGGNDGSTGDDSTFGTHLTGYAGGGGGGNAAGAAGGSGAGWNGDGVNATTGSGVAGGSCFVAAAANGISQSTCSGGPSTNAASTPGTGRASYLGGASGGPSATDGGGCGAGGASGWSGGGGGSGGGSTTGPAVEDGCAGGNTGPAVAGSAESGGGGAAGLTASACGAGGEGQAGAAATSLKMGQGGGGGASKTGAGAVGCDGGVGGAGGGGGGGGGGASGTGSPSGGSGGNGGNGKAWVWTYY